MLTPNRHQQASRAREAREQSLYTWKRTDVVSATLLPSTSIACLGSTKKPLWIHPGAVYYPLRRQNLSLQTYLNFFIDTL